jgi:hypothetical protein
MGIRSTLDRRGSGSTTLPVDKELGTAYATVKSLSEKLPIIAYLEQNIDGFVTDIHNALDTSVAAEQSTVASAAAALASQGAAAASEAASHASELAADQSEANAAASQASALDSKQVSIDRAAAALASQNASHTSELNAKASEVASAASQVASHASELAAKTSETNAGNSALASSQSAGDSATAKVAAQLAESNAQTSETNASASAAAALASKVAAALSATNSGTSEQHAADSAAAAALSTAAIASATATDAGELTGAENATVSRGTGLLQTSLTKLGRFVRRQSNTYVVVITGQSNAAGAHNGGPNPANPLVKVWDGVTGAWGSSDYTQNPFARAYPDGNNANNNVGLAFAHRLADETGAKVYVVYDAWGGRPISDWVGAGTASVRYAGIKSKVEAALGSSDLAGRTTVDYLIWAQGEEDALTDDLATYQGKFSTLDNQFRAETWMKPTTPMFVMGMSGLHSRYQVWQAQLDYCENVNRACVYVNSSGLKTSYDVSASMQINVDSTTNFIVGDTVTNTVNGNTATGTIVSVGTSVLSIGSVSGIFQVGPLTSTSGGAANITSIVGSSDWTHWLGDSLWEHGYHRVWYASQERGMSHRQGPAAFYARGAGPWRGQPDAIANFKSLRSVESASSNFPLNGSAASGSISWGFQCDADGNYTMAGGYQTTTTNLCNYSFGWGRSLTFNDTADYSGGFGYQNNLTNTYQFAAGRGHSPAHSGETALGLFSKYTTVQTNPVLFQVGYGSSLGAAKNAITVRGDGTVELCGDHTSDPTQNKEITLEWASNTSLKLKMRGADGVVRSETLPINGNTFWDSGNLVSPMTLDTVQTVTGAKTFSVRPTFNGNTPWDAGNLANPMTLDTTQTVSGVKTFSATPVMSKGMSFSAGYDANGANIRINGGGSPDVLMRADASNFYMLLSSTAGATYNSLRPLYFNLATGAMTIDGTGAGTTFGGSVTLGAGSGGYGNPLVVTGGTYKPMIRGNSNNSSIEFVNAANTQLNMGITDAGVVSFPRARPTWAGVTPWDTGNLPSPAQTNGSIYTALHLRTVGGVDTTWNWTGQGGTPAWVWGGSDGANMYVYNPANFSVNYSNSAGSATTATNAGNLTGGYCNASRVRVTNAYGDGLASGGGSMSWNDNAGDGALWLGCNSAGAGGGIILRTVNANNSVELGRFSISAAGVGTNGSDIRLKDDIKTLEGSLDKIRAIRGVSYTYKASGEKHYGVIAQEVQPHFPNAVTTQGAGIGEGRDDYLGVAYTDLVAPLIEAVKELADKLDTALARIAELEGAAV